jgi:hypothetical protein
MFDMVAHQLSGGVAVMCFESVEDGPVFLDGQLFRLGLDARPSLLRSYDEEGAGHPMVLSLPIHPHLVGVRHRLPYFRDVLNLLQQRADTVFLTGSEICDWFLAQQDGS